VYNTSSHASIPEGSIPFKQRLERICDRLYLAHHAPSLAFREQMMTEIEEGEKGFSYDETAEDELRKRMGLPRRRKAKEEGAAPEEANQEQKTAKKRASSVGHRSPSHDPVKGGAETDEQVREPDV